MKENKKEREKKKEKSMRGEFREGREEYSEVRKKKRKREGRLIVKKSGGEGGGAWLSSRSTNKIIKIFLSPKGFKIAQCSKNKDNFGRFPQFFQTLGEMSPMLPPPVYASVYIL